MRKDYAKPTIDQVNLVPAEAVLGPCKSDIFPGPGPEGWGGVCRLDVENPCYGFGS